MGFFSDLAIARFVVWLSKQFIQKMLVNLNFSYVCGSYLFTFVITPFCW